MEGRVEGHLQREFKLERVASQPGGLWLDQLQLSAVLATPMPKWLTVPLLRLLFVARVPQAGRAACFHSLLKSFFLSVPLASLGCGGVYAFDLMERKSGRNKGALVAISRFAVVTFNAGCKSL